MSIQQPRKIGILAYGSLIDYPGEEIAPLIVERIECITPFNIEFARLSSTRSNAPTLVPVTTGGQKVKAVLLVLKNDTPVEIAESMLWRRERHKTGSNEIYKRPEKPTKNSVLVESLKNFEGVETVLYTSLPQNMGIFTKPEYLAYFGIKSILSLAGESGKDGIRYLLAAKKNNIVTEHSQQYEKMVLEQTGTENLEDAIKKLDAIRPKTLQIENEFSAFEKEVKEIADLICDYGLKKTFGDNEPELEKQKEAIIKNKEQFIANCHEGFKQGQLRIIKLLQGVQERSKQANEDLKISRREKNKQLATELFALIENLKIQENIVRHLADTIAYQMLQGQLHIMRRLYMEVGGNISLSNSNFQSVLAVAEEINSKPGNMALITDLTGYIQTGDLLCLIDGRLVIGEVKEGSKNLHILEILKEIQEEGKSAEDAKEKHKLDDYSYKQLKRNIRQQEVMKMVSEIINTDKGTDPLTNEPFKFLTPDGAAPRYFAELHEQKKYLDKSNMLSYNVIDDCLYIGMYKGPFRFMGAKILQSMYNKPDGNYAAMDMFKITESVNKPIFFLPFEKEFIFDILFGRIKLLFILDLDDYMKVFSKVGYKAEWGTTKETTKAKEIINKRMSGMLVYKNRGIKIKVDDDNDIWLFNGNLLKIFFEQIYPSYTAYSTRYYLEQKE